MRRTEDSRASQEVAAQETLVGLGDGSLGSVGSGDREGTGRSFAPGERVGRYVILERVGAGGMGVVYAAYDPDLDRKVAIKLLRAGLGGTQASSGGRSLLLREAQAMAKLSHPNVVAVHDVGVADEQLFLAMEFISGRTLARWLAEGRHETSEILAAFVRAGHGLRAAHEAGLIHRDFKPENVLLCESGAIKVTDFGLARATGRRAITEDALTPDEQARAQGRTPHASQAMGTPAYMAPEQHMGLEVDARADQFSFCVALWEALAGRRPFEGASRAELLMHMMEGQIADAPPTTVMPATCRKALQRGLSVEASGRWPSMKELLAALEPTGAARPKTGLWVLLGGLVVAAVVIGAQALGERTPPVCAGMERYLEGVWDPATRDQVRQSLSSSGVGFSASTWARVEPALDAYTRAWLAMRTDACEATQIRGEQSQALLDLRMTCLDERLRAVEGLVTVLRAADPTAVQNAIVAVSALGPLDRCADAEALRARFPRPEDPAIAALVDELDATLSLAEARERAGQYARGLELTAAVVSRSSTLDYPPLRARALRFHGSLTAKSGDEAEGERLLREAFFLAVRHDLDELASQAAADLVQSIGVKQSRPAEGRPWADHALAYAAAEDDELLRAHALYHLGAVALHEGKYDEARQYAEEALAIRERIVGENHESVLASINQLGLIASDLGELDGARAHFARGFALGRQVLGEDHPDLARFINNRAKLDWMQGDFPAAKAAFEEALVLQERAFGPHHRNVAQLHNNLAAVAASTNDLDEAQRRFELALAIWEEVLGSDHPQVADALNNLAVVAASRGDDHAARAFDERALAIRERTMDPGHPDLAQAYHNLGEDLRRLGRLDEALALHIKALAIWEARLDPSHDSIAAGLTTLAHDWLDLDEPDKALALLLRAKAIRDAGEAQASDRALTDFLLAKALWSVTGPRRDRKRALALATSARAQMLEDPADGRNLAELEVWLADLAPR